MRDSRVGPGRMRKQFKTRKAALALARENLVEQVFLFAAPTSTKNPEKPTRPDEKENAAVKTHVRVQSL